MNKPITDPEVALLVQKQNLSVKAKIMLAYLIGKGVYIYWNLENGGERPWHYIIPDPYMELQSPASPSAPRVVKGYFKLSDAIEQAFADCKGEVLDFITQRLLGDHTPNLDREVATAPSKLNETYKNL